MGKFLYEDMQSLSRFNSLEEMPEIIENGLSKNIVLRDYQKEAFKYFITYMEKESLSKNKQIHTLFHMATGSGKTVIMAGLILYLYTKGYRNFLFFVNQTNILEKTKENFLNNLSNKYLFSDEIDYLGEKIKINKVENFIGASKNYNDINICFSTTQKLHMDLFSPKENSITYNDFENEKIVFISDESHHVNTMTKKLNKEEKENKKSWEYSVMKAFSMNKDHIMLEFTATADLKDKNVKEKYMDKLIFNYPLIEFRKSGYTKDFQNFASNSSLWDRALMAIIMSEYRKYLFADAGINIKPVVLFKSQKIKESESFYNEFFDKVKELSEDDINKLNKSGINELANAINYFKRKDPSMMLIINSLKDSFSKENAIIMNGSSDNTKEQQLQVNSLEDKDNPIRFIFAVDMLNEGWDVLNLFDIVRLYDTRQSGKKISNYTIREAQLIGRGARYCPFKIHEYQEKFKRKYDHDLGNENRILETMYFHSKDDSKYISELKRALIDTGMEDEHPIKLTYELKDSFKESLIYKKGIVFSNKRVKKDRLNIKEIEESKKNTVYHYTVSDSRGKINSLFDESNLNKDSEYKMKTKSLKFKEISYNILSGASENYRELRFSVLKEKYPSLKSTREFLTGDKYLGNNILEIHYSVDEVKGKDIYVGLVNAFDKISSHIFSLKLEYEGSREFSAIRLSDVIKNKTIYVSSVDVSGGIGESQNNNKNSNYQLELFSMDWYVYNDNYGTSEEKLFIKHFNREIKPLLEEKGLKFFLIRNERIPELAIYSFSDGERFEPDFLLFVQKENIDNESNYQAYIEPKGSHLLLKDAWKEKFLLEIEENHKIEQNVITMSNDYVVLGLPFFNSNERRNEFDNAVNEWIKKI
ncbi:DEAD/DEAH box helicase family protein [Finegoldia sp. BIOML-A1]|uniref:DEAD/DEAH box helicase family protein n=1 Tax=Finegoldia sp. BIOML-A1 TaxID=2584649 RepID=UPI0012B072F0|nr:DEAD/DEAH box helicase family protein [Finegoldia sp. BIOML-A1]MSB11627.1 type III restriction endonuclease subunit R [Finegoldia sp. BIOML-A1]